MFPDLRIVIVTVISTFVLTVGVGFYTSSRLLNERNKRVDPLAAREETPVNRIALSWPEPTRQSEPLALDFAVTAKALRNPVRDVTPGSATIEAQPPQKELPLPAPVVERAAEFAQPMVNETAIKEPAIKETAVRESSIKGATEKEVAIATPARAAAPTQTISPPPVATSPQTEISIAIQYPPVPELPAELKAPTIGITPAPSVAATTPQQPESPVTTGSVVATSPSAETAAPKGEPESAPKETRIASRPDPANVEPEKTKQVQQAAKESSIKGATEKEEAIATPAPAAAPTQTISPPPVATSPQTEISIAIQYPPVPELPAELKAPTIDITPAPSVAATTPQQPESPVTTGSVVATSPSAEIAAPKGEPDSAPIASRPDPANVKPEKTQQVGRDSAPNSPARAARKKAAPKKAAPKKAAPKKAAPAKAAKQPAKAARRPIVRTVTPSIPSSPQNFLGHGFSN
jgi:hypothetical protein